MPANKFTVEWSGFNEFAGMIDGFTERFIENLVDEMQEYTLLVETGARALAFRDTGELEESIISKAVVVEGETVIGEVGTNLHYALYIHEKPYHNGVGDKYDNGILIEGYYVKGRGERTRSKPPWRGEMPGRKYFERAVVLTEQDFYDAMDRAFDKTVKEMM